MFTDLITMFICDTAYSFKALEEIWFPTLPSDILKGTGVKGSLVCNIIIHKKENYVSAIDITQESEDMRTYL